MRVCQCGGIILQYAVKAGEAWHCDACNRHQVMVRLQGQVLATLDSTEALGFCSRPETGRVASTESGDQGPFAFQVPIAD